MEQKSFVKALLLVHKNYFVWVLKNYAKITRTFQNTGDNIKISTGHNFFLVIMSIKINMEQQSFKKTLLLVHMINFVWVLKNYEKFEFEF